MNVEIPRYNRWSIPRDAALSLWLELSRVVRLNHAWFSGEPTPHQVKAMALGGRASLDTTSSAGHACSDVFIEQPMLR